MGKWCLHASSFIFDRIILKVAGNLDRPLVSMANLYVVCFCLFVCFFFVFFSMRFYLSTLDSGERSLPFGLLVVI